MLSDLFPLVLSIKDRKDVLSISRKDYPPAKPMASIGTAVCPTSMVLFFFESSFRNYQIKGMLDSLTLILQ